MNLIMKSLYVVLTVSISSACYSQSNFIGIGFQKDIKESWNLSLKEIDNKSFQVRYPSIPCTAIWKVVKQTNDYVVYKEKLTSGYDRCIDNGYIFIVNDTFSNSTKRFYIFEKAGDDNPYAYGFLEKIEN